MHEFIVSKRAAGQRAATFLKKELPNAGSGFIYKMLRKKNITLNDKKSDGNEVLVEGDSLKVYFSDETFAKFSGKSIENFGENSSEKASPKSSEKSSHKSGDGDLQKGSTISNFDLKNCIIYEDDDILAINKPADMLSQKANKNDVSLTEYIREYLNENYGESEGFKAGVCNRLDRNTSGVIVAGKSVYGLQRMNEAFGERLLEKHYLCMVQGEMIEKISSEALIYKDRNHNTATVYLNPTSVKEGSSKISTEFSPVKCAEYKGKTYTLLDVTLHTGKSHQIRAHLKALGFPVVGDSKYGTKELYKIFKKDFSLTSQFLHAYRLKFSNESKVPEKYRGLEIVAELPQNFKKITDKVFGDF